MKTGEQLKIEGMQAAAEHRAGLLQSAKQAAFIESVLKPTVTVDDVYNRLVIWEASTDLKNAWGSVFRGKEWRFTGEWRKSVRPSNHGRMIRVWEYVG